MTKLRAHAVRLLIIVIALGATPAKARLSERKIAKLGEVLTEDRVFYRWQSTTSGENLVNLGTMDEATNAYFMSRTKGIALGPGIYLAGGPSSSASYMPKSGGNLIEVRIAKGTRVIDVEDQATLLKMKLLGVKVDQLSSGALPASVVLKYDTDWYVGKHLTGKSTFQQFPTAPVTAKNVVAWHREIAGEQARDQLLEQVRLKQPAVMAEIHRDARYIDVALASADPAQAVNLLREKFNQPISTEDAMNVWQKVSRRPDVTRLATSDLHLGPRLVRDMHEMIKANLAGDLVLDSGYAPMLSKFIDQASTPVAEQRTALRALITAHMRDARLANDPSELARVLRPLIGRAEFTPVQSGAFASKLSMIVNGLDADVRAAPEFIELLNLAHAKAPGLIKRLESLSERRALIDRAIQTDAKSAMVAALRRSTSSEDLYHTYHELNRGLHQSRIGEAIHEFTRVHADEFRALFKTSEDYQIVTRLASNISDSHLHSIIYAAAVDAGPGARESYFSACIDDKLCRPKLLDRIRLDHGRIFRGLESYLSFVEHIEELGYNSPALKNEVMGLLIESTESPAEVARLARALVAHGVDADSKKLLLANARRRGLMSFRTSELIELRRLGRGDIRLTRELTNAAIDAAAGPRDVIAVAREAQFGPAAGLGQNVSLARRMGQLGPSPEDVASFQKLRPLAPSIKIDPHAPLDCVNALSRLVDP